MGLAGTGSTFLEMHKWGQVCSAWDTVVEWIERNNYEVDMSRPSYEIYLNNPEEHPEKHHIIDICRSVKAK